MNVLYIKYMTWPYFSSRGYSILKHHSVCKSLQRQATPWEVATSQHWHSLCSHKPVRIRLQLIPVPVTMFLLIAHLVLLAPRGPHLQVHLSRGQTKEHLPFQKTSDNSIKSTIICEPDETPSIPLAMHLKGGYWRKWKNQDFATAIHPVSSYTSLQPPDLNEDRREIPGATISWTWHQLSGCPNNKIWSLSFSFSLCFKEYHVQ